MSDERLCTLRDLADDCFDRPLFGPPDAETTPNDRHRAIRTAIKQVRRILPASVGGINGLATIRDIHAPPGERLCYALTARAAAWLRPRLEEVLNA
jgi:hypothetical protein